MANIMPVPCAAITRSNQVRRRVFCRHYGDCLDLAIEKKWTNFACDECEIYQDERLSASHRPDEEERCIILAYLSTPVDYWS